MCRLPWQLNITGTLSKRQQVFLFFVLNIGTNNFFVLRCVGQQQSRSMWLKPAYLRSGIVFLSCCNAHNKSGLQLKALHLQSMDSHIRGLQAKKAGKSNVSCTTLQEELALYSIQIYEYCTEVLIKSKLKNMELYPLLFQNT